ncbi:hypothetical protein LguiA_002379 [Lonicera macranthoides]
MSRGARFGRGSFFRGSSGGGPLVDRERAAAGVHFSSSLPSPFESKEEIRCKSWRTYLEKSIADSEAVGDDCLSCDQFFELMSGCPGVENIKYNTKGSISDAVKKLPKKERWCINLTQLSMRAVRDYEFMGMECDVCDSYKKIIKSSGCEGYEEVIAHMKEEAVKKKKEEEGA